MTDWYATLAPSEVVYDLYADGLYAGPHAQFCLNPRHKGPCKKTDTPEYKKVVPKLRKVPGAPGDISEQQRAGHAANATLAQAMQRGELLADQLGLRGKDRQGVQHMISNYGRQLHARNSALQAAQHLHDRLQQAHDRAQAQNLRAQLRAKLTNMRRADHARKQLARELARQAKHGSKAGGPSAADTAEAKQMVKAAGFAFDPDELETPSMLASLDPQLYALAAIPADVALYGLHPHAYCGINEFCRNPLHPGPCKGWKHMLHSVAPGAYHAYERSRVDRLNERRVERVKQLRAAGQRVPAHLLKPITYDLTPKAPSGTSFTPPTPAQAKAALPATAKEIAAKIAARHAATAPAAPKGAPSLELHRAWATHSSPHSSSQARVAAWEKVSRADFDTLTPNQQKSVLGDLKDIKDQGALSDASRASDLLKRFTTPGGKLPDTRDDAAKAKAAANAPALAPAARVFVYRRLDKRQYDGLDADTKSKILKDIDHQIQHGSPQQASTANDLKQRLTGPGVSIAPAPAPAASSSTPGALAPHPLVGKHVTAVDDQGNPQKGILRDVKQYTDAKTGKVTTVGYVQRTTQSGALHKVPTIYAVKADTIKADPHAPGAPTPVAPSAPLPATASAAAKHAAAVANRTAPKAHMAKTHIDAYGKMTKAEFDALPPDAQKTIRDDLANAKAKFLAPDKKQAAQDLLDRFGAKHPAAPAAPSAAKGYSDPMTEAMKAVRTEPDRSIVLSRVGVLSHSQLADLTPADRQSVVNRLDAISGSGTLPQHVKDQAAAYKRIIEHGSTAQTDRKWDHEPAIGELHLHEQKMTTKNAGTADALKAAGAGSMPRAERIKALTQLDKKQFDALAPEDQRKITDALHGLHIDQQTTTGPRMTVHDKEAEQALTTYTGLHPGVHRLRQAEADYRAGKIGPNELRSEYIRARVQAPAAYGDASSPGAQLEREAQRVAEENPKLPPWLRAEMIDNPYGKPSYYSISQAQNQYNFEDAPRLSQNDISDIFRASSADLAGAHPIHAEAVQALRERLIKTGFAPGSPWSDATKNHVVDNLLHISYRTPEIPQDRLDDFHKLPAGDQLLIRKAVRDRLDAQTNEHAKTATSIALRQLEGRPYTGTQRDVMLKAADSFPTGAQDVYRKLAPTEFDYLPGYAQGAIIDHLHSLQKSAEASNGATRIWGPTDDPLTVMPDALAAHLTETRNLYPSSNQQTAADIANYGRGIMAPFDRYRQYAFMGGDKYDTLKPADQRAIDADLDRIAHDSLNPLQTRYGALYTKDVALSPNGFGPQFDAAQVTAVDRADPTPGLWDDGSVSVAFRNLPKSSYDTLDPTYREAIDARIKLLPAADQQALMAKFHPQLAAATPAGYTPSTAVTPRTQDALDTIYGVHPKAHTMAHQLSTYGKLRGSDYAQLNAQEQSQLLGDLSYIATTSKGPSGDKARKLLDRFSPPGTPSGGFATPPVIPPANSVPGQARYATPQVGTLVMATDKGAPGDGWTTTPGGKRVWGKYGAAGLLLMHQDPATGERRYLMVQRGPAISDPGKWQFPGGAIDQKETFHQGGAREVIEELGFKPDALKDAAVHGEHTHSIPGSSWKYVSVAASVPHMLKPDLSTHHARAETSDAQWMTEDQIRKLDRDGKLLAPLAGGKLEQNVLSLFPAQLGGGTQAQRPGPITKRLGRMNLPAGGRVPASASNAYSAPHKPSKGRDLIPDKTASDKLRQDLKTLRKQYDGKTADGRLAAIGALQGFDDTPTVVSKAEMDRLLATGDYIEAWRGVKGTRGKTAAEINEDMRSGPAYYGKGIFGNGYYLATDKTVVTGGGTRYGLRYHDGTKNSIVRILIPKSAITKKYDEITPGSSQFPASSKAKGVSFETGTLYDPGRYAAAKGIDGIEIPHNTRSRGGGAGHVAQPGKPAYNWLNRSVLIIQEAE